LAEKALNKQQAPLAVSVQVAAELVANLLVAVDQVELVVQVQSYSSINFIRSLNYGIFTRK
jgi:hypothetical protein